jgi:hypothetical protein
MHARHHRFCLIFFILYTLYASIGAGLELGVGAGVASYPGALDPYELMDHVPVVYPRIELIVPVAQKWQIRCCAHRWLYEVNLHGCFCLQSLTTNFLSLGCAMRLGNKGDIMIGMDGLYGFCMHDHGGSYINSNTYGVKLHVSAQQPLWRDLSYVLRTGVQQERIMGTDDLPDIDMTIFTVECMVVLGL